MWLVELESNQYMLVDLDSMFLFVQHVRLDKKEPVSNRQAAINSSQIQKWEQKPKVGGILNAWGPIHFRWIGRCRRTSKTKQVCLTSAKQNDVYYITPEIVFWWCLFCSACMNICKWWNKIPQTTNLLTLSDQPKHHKWEAIVCDKTE